MLVKDGSEGVRVHEPCQFGMVCTASSQLWVRSRGSRCIRSLVERQVASEWVDLVGPQRLKRKTGEGRLAVELREPGIVH